jgi:hypothetical protein
MDPRWKAFAEVCQGEFGGCGFQAELIQACRGNEDIAWAVYFHLRNHAMDWLRRPVPALAGKTPESLIDSGNRDEVRHCLWRMH